MSLIHMSFMGAVLIGVVVIIRAVMMNRLPKKTFLILWGIIILRLMLPFTVTSQLSIYSLFHQNAITGNGNSYEAVYAPENVAGAMMKGSDVWQIGAEDNKGTADMVNWNAIPIWTVVWLTGCIACSLFFLISYVISKRKFAVSVPVDNEFAKKWLAAHQIKRTIEIRQSGAIKAPLTYGLFRPVILMPDSIAWGNQKQLSYILAHEYIHIRRFDIFMKIVLLATLCVHWFNPFVWVMYLLCNRDIEISCDEAVISAFGIQARADYAYSLIHMEEMKSGFMPLCNSFSKNAIEERITAIMKTKKVTVLTTLAAVFLIAGIFLVFATTAKKETAGIDSTGSMPYSISQSSDFEKYEQFGLSYDKESGYLMYDNKKVGYFMDETAEEVYTRFYDETGEIGISIARDKNWEVVGIEQFPMSELYFDEDIAAVEIGDAAASDKNEVVYAKNIQLLEMKLEQLETENISLKEKISDTEEQMKLLEKESEQGADKEDEVKILLKEKEQIAEKQRIVEKQIETLTTEKEAAQESAE